MAASPRSLRADDRDAVVALSRHALARPEDQVGNPVWSTREELENEVADWDPAAEETLLVVEDAGRVIGFGGVELPRGFDHAELFGPLVEPAFQGQRIGARLLAASLELARAHRSTRVLGAVGTRNAIGRMLLERAGFHARGVPQATYRLTRETHRPIEDAPAGVQVRVATLADLDAALALYRECFPDGRFPEAVWRENLAAGTVYVADADGHTVAVLNIDPADRWIYHVGVTASERNRGVGSYLLSHALVDYWARRPRDALGLDVSTDNTAAIRLYRRQGFAPWLVLQTFELEL